MIKIKEFDGKDFNKDVSEGVVLVDFYADWCGPCKMMGRVLESIEDINILKVNTDEYTDLALNFGIMSIPTLILFKNGSEVDKLIGLQSKEDIIKFVKGE